MRGRRAPLFPSPALLGKVAPDSGGTPMKSVLPLTTVVLAIVVIWYLAAALMNAPLQRDQFANAGRTDYSTQDLVGASLNMERPKLPAPHQVASRALQARLRHPADVEAQPRLSRAYHTGRDADRLRNRLGFGHRSCRSDRLHALARALDDALDRRLADRADHRARADDRRHPQPVQHYRHCAEGGDRGLSLVLSGDGRHGQGIPFARSIAARPHAHLFGDASADVSEAAGARPARHSSSPA